MLKTGHGGLLGKDTKGKKQTLHAFPSYIVRMLDSGLPDSSPCV